MPFSRSPLTFELDWAADSPSATPLVPPADIVAPSGNRRRKSDRSPISPAPAPPLNQPNLALSIALRHQAIAAEQQGDYLTALALLQQLLSYGAEAQDYSHRGCIYLKQGQPIEAIADFDRAIELAANPTPTLAETYLNRGDAVMMTGAYDDALHNYSEALLLNPQDVRLWINRGVVLRNLRLYPLAIQSFDQALRLGSMGGHIYRERGRTYELTGDWNCACADYRRSIDCFQQDLNRQPDFNTDSTQQLLDQVQAWLTALIGQA